MITGIVICFILGYLAIVFEHPLKLDKTVPALIMGAMCWAIIALGHLDVVHMSNENGVLTPHVGDMKDVLLHHIGKVAEILFFLIGAMTIVELIDLHRGFAVITNRIRTTKKSTMLWLIGILAFFLSATLDNLAATIVLVSLLRRLVPNKEERLWFISMAVIAANAGGAWSPIGDVTTTMLWIGEKVSTIGLITNLVIPSFVCLIVPFFIASRMKAFRGNISPASGRDFEEKIEEEKLLSSKAMLIAGLGGLIFVPIFKSVTHLPPYVGMMLSLGVVWLVSEYIHPEEDFDEERKAKYSAHHALSRIEMSSILFFLGILVAVAALESVAIGHGEHKVGLLMSTAEWLQNAVPNQDIVVMLLGVLSAIIDNVPLVAASMGMYTEGLDARLWHFIAFAAGTGGSMLIIGSAAGVAAMGMEKINFIWYLKNITWLAFLGFFAGCLSFIALTSMF